MKAMTMFFLSAALVSVALLRADAAGDIAADWAKAVSEVAATRKAPIVTETRNGLVRPTVTETRTNPCGCVGCECGCADGLPCTCDLDVLTGKCKCRKAPAKPEPKKVGKVFDDQDAAAKWKDALVQAPLRWTQGGVVYDVPVFSGGVMYGTPVTDIALLGPPPPTIYGTPIVTTIPYTPPAATYAASPVIPAATYYPAAAAAVVPTYQYQQQSYYYPPQQQTNYSYRQGGLFGQRRSYDVQQSYTAPTVATYGGYRQTGAMICGPNGCTPGGN